VLFEKRFWAGIADGSVTVAFRRRRRPQVVAGRPYRTAAGIVDVLSVTAVDPSSISDGDALAAGYDDAHALRADLRGTDGQPTYRIEFRRAQRPDPRAQLAAADDLSDEDVAEIDRRLARLDRASTNGPWTIQTLWLIGERPAVRAGDLAAELGRERLSFKTDVRKLKSLGLTESLQVGYQLSPRGRAYLGGRQRAGARLGPT
jgi:hypothetical protein